MRQGMGGMILVPRSRCRLRIAVPDVTTPGAQGSLGLQGNHKTQWAPERESMKRLGRNRSSTDIKF